MTDAKRIIGYHDFVMGQLRQRLGSLPEQGHGGTYRVKNDGSGSDAVRLYSGIGLSTLDNNLEWGARRDIITDGEVVPSMEGTDDMTVEDFVLAAMELEYPRIVLEPFKLYMVHTESFGHGQTGRGRWEIASENMVNVTYEERRDFSRCPTLSDYPSLKGEPIGTAAIAMIDHLFGMYEKMDALRSSEQKR